MFSKFADAQQIISDFRSASTARDKREVIRNVKKGFPEIAERFSKLLVQGKGVSL